MTTKTKKDDTLTLDDLMGDIEKQTQVNTVGGKVAVWLDQNPEKAKLFWQAVDTARERGYNITAVIAACQNKLGGPPGAHSTLRIAINERDRRNKS